MDNVHSMVTRSKSLNNGKYYKIKSTENMEGKEINSNKVLLDIEMNKIKKNKKITDKDNEIVY